MSYLLALLGFAALIILHEFGHFVAAKAVGMYVERFSLFFGPPVVKFRHGETEYGVGVIPLGGYVTIAGMNPRQELPPEAPPKRLLQPAGLEAGRSGTGWAGDEPGDCVHGRGGAGGRYERVELLPEAAAGVLVQLHQRLLGSVQRSVQPLERGRFPKRRARSRARDLAGGI